MREFEFRVWDLLGKRMLGWGEIFVLPAWEIFPGTPEQRAVEVMQYSGLKDKNNKKVFEGDIVRVMNEIHVVRFECGGFMAGDGFLDDYWNMNGHMYEVVGNKFENPELLEGAAS